LAAGFWPKNLAFARKMMALPDLGGSSPHPSGLYACEYSMYAWYYEIRSVFAHSI